MTYELTPQLEGAIRAAFRAGRSSGAQERAALPPAGNPAVVRRAAFVAEVRAADDSDRTVTGTISTERTDRYGDILRASGFDTKEFEKNPVILWAHNSSLPPVARALSVWKETNPPALAARIEFATEDVNPFGAQIGKMYRAGYLNSFSVGFRPTAAPTTIIDEETGRMTGYEYRAMELLEVSGVPIPANADARIRCVVDGIATVAEAASLVDELRSRLVHMNALETPARGL